MSTGDGELLPIEDAETSFAIEYAAVYEQLKHSYDTKQITWEKLGELLHSFYLVGWGQGMRCVGDYAESLQKKRKAKNERA